MGSLHEDHASLVESLILAKKQRDQFNVKLNALVDSFDTKKYSYPMWSAWYVTFKGHQISGPHFTETEASEDMDILRK